MVRDNEASSDIWLSPETGAVWGLNANKIAIESSTLTLNWTRELANKIVQTGATFLDAPVLGSRPQTEAKQLIYLVGGETESLAKVQPVLQAAGAGTIHHIGTIGQGMLMKLAVNSLFGIQVAAMAETISLLNQDGITPEQALECLGQLPVVSPAAKGAGSLMVAQKHAPMFPISLVAKDFQYATQTAQDINTSMPATTAIYEIYQQGIANGYGDANITGIFELLASDSKR